MGSASSPASDDTRPAASLLRGSGSQVDLKALLAESVRTERGSDDRDEVRWERAMNPLAPCGACTEWIKKLMEVNPDFKVVTFTSASCARVFVKSIDLS